MTECSIFDIVDVSDKILFLLHVCIKCELWTRKQSNPTSSKSAIIKQVLEYVYLQRAQNAPLFIIFKGEWYHTNYMQHSFEKHVFWSREKECQ